MRIFVGMFGLNRSMRWTWKNLRRNVLDPLEAWADEVKIYCHFNIPTSIENPRAGERKLFYRPQLIQEMAFESMWLERQDDIKVFEQIRNVLDKPFLHENDPSGTIRRNLAYQLYSLKQLSSLIPLGDEFDVYALIRPDLMYLDRLVPERDLCCIVRENTDMITPSWQRWHGGFNDRFCFANRRGAEAFMNRWRMVKEYSETNGYIHSEGLLRYAAEEAKLKVSYLDLRARRVRATGRLHPEFGETRIRRIVSAAIEAVWNRQNKGSF